MSDGALSLLHRIRELMNSPAAREPGWYFGAGVTDADHEELATNGLIIKLLGTEHGFAWRLTEAGSQRISSPPAAPAA